MNDIHEQARGRWQDILRAVGLPAKFLTGVHTSCPLCGGKDRARFDDRGGSGSYICTHCGAGRGVDLVMKFLQVDFRTAKAEILKHLPSATVVIRKATANPSTEAIRDYLGNLWAKGMRLNGEDPASRYLMSRGLWLDPWPSQLRFVSRACYKHDDGSKSYHPAMVAKFVSPDATAWTMHFTYLDPTGRKADVPKVRKLAPLPVPQGGCVRLSKSAEAIGVAEGIETALSASLLHGMPVWATLSAGAMVKWQPPVTAKRVIVFADNDASFTGQTAAYSLAYNLKGLKFDVEVCLPPGVGTDWNDVLQQQERAA